MSVCARCGRELSTGGEARVPGWIAAVASTAMAFLHAGMWMRESLDAPFCARCRRRIVVVISALSAVVLSAAAAGVAVWLRGPRGRP